MKPQRTRVGAYALLQENGRLLLCRISRELPRWEGKWTLPGGGIEFGEDPQQAMVREVEEETGLVVRATSIATVSSIVDRSGVDDFHGIRIIYFAEIIGGQLRHEQSGSTDCCEWHDLHRRPTIDLVDLAEVGIAAAQCKWTAR